MTTYTITLTQIALMLDRADLIGKVIVHDDARTSDGHPYLKVTFPGGNADLRPFMGAAFAFLGYDAAHAMTFAPLRNTPQGAVADIKVLRITDSLTPTDDDLTRDFGGDGALQVHPDSDGIFVELGDWGLALDAPQTHHLRRAIGKAAGWGVKDTVTIDTTMSVVITPAGDGAVSLDLHDNGAPCGASVTIPFDDATEVPEALLLALVGKHIVAPKAPATV
ncbi:hypothetical protein [Streptosporangium sp. NPDC002524]|uniref:hypothetical protein n=1 Tax=Streptosporangium sp. NPDC002524 TaxID=3154537 RepID=UPI0033206FEF